ncbi:hypothetical protein C8Q78DRAFT_685125 [Trametes maxima]|nr:hypothetical protein C8Q78DRAFT_685125 [Trametes maxima]
MSPVASAPIPSSGTIGTASRLAHRTPIVTINCCWLIDVLTALDAAQEVWTMAAWLVAWKLFSTVWRHGRTKRVLCKSPDRAFPLSSYLRNMCHILSNGRDRTLVNYVWEITRLPLSWRIIYLMMRPRISGVLRLHIGLPAS